MKTSFVVEGLVFSSEEGEGETTFVFEYKVFLDAEGVSFMNTCFICSFTCGHNRSYLPSLLSNVGFYYFSWIKETPKVVSLVGFEGHVSSMLPHSC